MPYQTRLPAALNARGLAVELVPGWQTRGSSSFNPKGAVSHWTAGARTGDRGSLNICVNGRSGLPGPLCNVFLPRHSEVAIVVAAGRANHAGVGGYRGLVGNSSVFGTEAENSGNGEWTAWQRHAYPRINAAFADLGGFDASMCCGHFEWTSRKPDPRDYTMDRMRREIAAILAGGTPTTPEDDLPLNDADKQWIANTFLSMLKSEGVSGGGDVGRTAAGVAPAVWKTNIWRDDKPISALQELADAKTLALSNAARLDALAAAVAEIDQVDEDALAADIAERLRQVSDPTVPVKEN